jgi:hypothetical protein
MTKQFLTIFFLVLILPALLFAGQTVIGKADGSVQPFNSDEILPVQKARLVDNPVSKGISPLPLGTEGLIDTVYQTDFGWGTYVRFNFYGRDVMIQWFKAPADMTLKSVGFSEGYADAGDNVGNQVDVKVVTANWTEQEFIDATTTQAPNHWGYFEAPGNGYNDAAPLMEDPDGNIYSTWHVVDSTQFTPPWGMDLWSDAGIGAPITVDPLNAPAPEDKFYYWVDMSLLMNEPQLTAGQMFGIVVTNSSPTMDDNNVLLWACNDAVPYGAFKYYANGRNNPGVDYGWWSRLYAWDMAWVADITGDLPPAIANVSEVLTTLSTAPQTVTADVTDENPGGTPGVASVYVLYSTDGMATWDSTAMTVTTAPEYTGDIPGQVPGTVIDWYVKATDNNGNVTTRGEGQYQYQIFLPSGAPTLVIFNGQADSGYPSDYYFAPSTFSFWHDVWAYGAFTAELVNNYTTIIEIATNLSGAVINSDVIRTWIEASGDHNYLLAGDEWLGTQTGWTNTVYSAGSFQYDILGIAADYNDVNYAVTGDQNLPSRVVTVPGSALGDSLEWKRIQEGIELDSMQYDPYFEIEVANWLDGVDVLGDVEVDLLGIGVAGDTFNIAIHRTLPAGNKIAFFTYDPLSLNSAPSGDATGLYYWFGYHQTAPQVQFLRWAGFVLPNGLGGFADALPGKFNLSQNYPNPFNPSTTIEYSVATTGKVELAIYNVQGQKISTLVSGNKTAGSYKTTFDASNLASGVYFYKLTAGSDILTKKMLVVK